jgi:hypothetical protein
MREWTGWEVDQRGYGPTHFFVKACFFFVPWWSSELTQLVRNARRARRWHTMQPCAEAWGVDLEALHAKGEAIEIAKAAHFKQAVAETARGR